MLGEIKRTTEDWDLFFFGMAAYVSGQSKDPHRKVGAVLVPPSRRQVSIGYNGFPADVPDVRQLLQDVDQKRKLMVHAEMNCLKQSPFNPDGCTLYVTRCLCTECAVEAINRRVARVVIPKPDFNASRWGLSWRMGLEAMRKAKVTVTQLDVPDVGHVE